MSAETASPIPAEALRHLHLRLRRSVPARGSGQHLRRILGQSLEFREYRRYEPGDDIRLVDWKASVRTPGGQTLLIRRFEAEVQLCLVVLVDMRPAMRLPLAAPKLLVALWMMQALAELAAATGDELVVAALFGPPELSAPLKARGRGAPALARRFAETVWSARGGALAEAPAARTDPVARILKPASAVVWLSDMLFSDPEGTLGHLARLAQMSRRELIVWELDSFPAESAGITGVRKLAAVEGRAGSDEPVVIDKALVAATRAGIDRHLSARRTAWSRGGLFWPPPIRWPVGADRAAMAALLRAGFDTLPVVRALAARGGA